MEELLDMNLSRTWLETIQSITSKGPLLAKHFKSDLITAFFCSLSSFLAFPQGIFGSRFSHRNYVLNSICNQKILDPMKRMFCSRIINVQLGKKGE